MTPEQYHQAKQCYFDVINAKPTDRKVLLAAIDDLEVRVHVEKLVAADGEVGSNDEFLAPITTNFSEIRSSPIDRDLLIGREIGEYRILERLGEGGFGSVYRAVRTDFKQEVALKLIRGDQHMRGDIVRRFQHERQYLAMLSHPHIAQIFNAGITNEGGPYFIMEFVRGANAITTYCDQQCFTISDRLKLFQSVCGAVQHSHNCGIIHCDLKPANILVSETGELKIVDFGVSRMASNQQQADYTISELPGASPLTPEYASPEQLRGHRPTTHSDVYALGVVLYELLVGTRPFALSGRSYDEAIGILRDEFPKPPSEALSHAISSRSSEGGRQGVAKRAELRQSEPKDLRRFIRGDLDTIVMMAMQKEVDRRYASPKDLADDIVRFFKREPLLARPDSSAYRIRRFAERNRLGVAVGTLVIIAVFGALFAVSYGKHVAEAALAEKSQSLVERDAAFDKAEELRLLESHQRSLAEKRLGLAEARRLTATAYNCLASDVVLGLLLARESIHLQQSQGNGEMPEAQAIQFMIDTLKHHGGTLRYESDEPIAFLERVPNRGAIVVGTRSGELRVIAISPNDTLENIESSFKVNSTVDRVAIANNGRYLACLGQRDKERVMNAMDLNSHSQTQRHIRSGYGDHDKIVWSSDSANVLVSRAGGEISSLAFDGEELSPASVIFKAEDVDGLMGGLDVCIVATTPLLVAALGTQSVKVHRLEGRNAELLTDFRDESFFPQQAIASGDASSFAIWGFTDVHCFFDKGERGYSKPLAKLAVSPYRSDRDMNRITVVSYMSNDEFLVVGTSEGDLLAWSLVNIDDENVAPLFKSHVSGAVTCLDYDDATRCIVAGTTQGKLYAWVIDEIIGARTTPNVILQAHPGPIQDIKIISEEGILVSTDDHYVRKFRLNAPVPSELDEQSYFGPYRTDFSRVRAPAIQAAIPIQMSIPDYSLSSSEIYFTDGDRWIQNTATGDRDQNDVALQNNAGFPYGAVRVDGHQGLLECCLSKRPTPTNAAFAVTRNNEFTCKMKTQEPATWIVESSAHSKVLEPVLSFPFGANLHIRLGHPILWNNWLLRGSELWDMSSSEYAPIQLGIESVDKGVGLAFSSDRQWLVVNDMQDNCVVWKLSTISHDIVPFAKLPELALGFSPAGDLVTLREDRINLWIASEDGFPREPTLTIDRVKDPHLIVFNDDSSRIAIVTRQSEAKVWSISKSTCHLQFTANNVTAVTFAKDDSVFLGTSHGKLSHYDSHGQRLNLIDTSVDRPIHSVAVNPATTHAAAASGSAIFHFDLRNSSVLELQQNASNIRSIAYSHDGRWLAALHEGGRQNLSVWPVDLETLLTIASETAGRELTAEERQTHLKLD
ncbi:MAG: protein kinase [Planctomycetes bacterium]|nr:protein kinase [Planctomycetota bacterium]